MKQKVNDELKQHFRPEFLNRIDDTIVFHQLNEAQILRIVDLMTARIETQLRNRDMGLELTDNAKKWLANKGWDPVMGARPLRRTIQREIEDSLSERILFNELKPGQIVVVDCEGDPANIETSKLVFRGADKPGTVPDAVPADLQTGSTDASAPTAESA
jgi:ATP-dependent Clp protease ATP-binding subunit ClpC